MKRTGRKQEWSLTMFAFGAVVFFPPVLGLFDTPARVLGLPVTYLILFALWAVIIFGIWLGARPSPLRGDMPDPNVEGPREPRFDQTHASSGRE
jgi:hypothetical protein